MNKRRRQRKINSDNDTLFFNEEDNDGRFHFCYGGLPYYSENEWSKNSVHYLLSRLQPIDNNYWDDVSLYEPYDIKNVYKT
jgi:hypothetical protein